MSSHTKAPADDSALQQENYAINYKEQLEKDVFAAISKPRPIFYVGLAMSIIGVIIGASSWAYQIITGLGVAGIMNPVGWGVYITDFVFWVGIAHSGTLISAILLSLIHI